MVGRECCPKGLLGIIIHVVIAMPGSSDVIKAPVGKQTRTPDAGFCSTIEKIKIPVLKSRISKLLAEKLDVELGMDM